MVQILKSVLARRYTGDAPPAPGRSIRSSTTILALLLIAPALTGARFYQDDPLEKEPAPMDVKDPRPRKLNEYYDFFQNTFFTPGECCKGTPLPAQGVNTIGEVPDSAWYQNRHGAVRMSREALVRGPDRGNAPSRRARWEVIAGKSEGVSPGFVIKDGEGRRYIVKFDPRSNLEMASAADVISSKFLYALGYNVPENYIVYFERRDLVIAPDANLKDAAGRRRNMTGADLDELLLQVPRDPEKGYRGVASLFIDGKILGPFRYHGTRSDDPNDIIPHEHRRELRGLRVVSSWLAHNDAKALNTLDTLVEQHGIHYIKHYLIDFGGSLGSDSFTAKSPRAGNEYMFAWKPSLLQMLTFGVYVPKWAKARYPRFPSIGNFESDRFDPEKWKPNYPIPAFSNALPDDEFWAAKKIMAFSNAQIEAIVGAGQIRDPEARSWLAQNLIARRDKIGRTIYRKVLPLDRFDVEDGRLVFEDLEVESGFLAERTYETSWSSFDNRSLTHTPLPGERGMDLPQAFSDAAQGAYFSVRIQSDQPSKTVTVFVRKEESGAKVVAVERSW